MLKVRERLRSLEIPTRIRALSEDQQFAIAILLGFLAPVLMTAALITGSQFWLMAQFPLSVVLLLPTVWLLKPWYDGLPTRSQRRFTTVPLAYYVLLALVFVGLALASAPSDRGWAAALLLLVWCLHFVYGAGIEPNNFPLERLRGRLARAAPVRVFATWCGLLGVLWFLQYAQDDPKYRPFLLGATLTLGGAGVAATVKVFTRVRKLSTALRLRTQDMIRSLEELHDAPDADRQGKQQTARRTWDALEIVLLTRVDTGFRTAGSFVLPSDAIKELEQTVMLAVDARTHDETHHQLAVDALRTVRAACQGHIDAVA
ncbi:hypothetical protein ACSCBZ_41330 [Streptomyces niveiscabiei]|uniref:hypothetical protein n=1 Tax=Streptomyces niveiscabiei TaxID=164115 RepID=UPI0006EB8021|nr:hypothetical protein [Streptomyces niveiscabiei]